MFAVEGDRLANERLEGGLVNFLSFVDVDRAAYILASRIDQGRDPLGSGRHRVACSSVSPVIELRPATWPALLMTNARLPVPPRVPRSDMTPCVQKNAWGSPVAIALTPTTWPASLTAVPWLDVPPRVPRSVITPSAQRNAWRVPAAVWPTPTTWPASLTALASLTVPPRVPRSLITPCVQRNAWSVPAAVGLEPPTTSPAPLMAV